MRIFVIVISGQIRGEVFKLMIMSDNKNTTPPPYGNNNGGNYNNGYNNGGYNGGFNNGYNNGFNNGFNNGCYNGFNEQEYYARNDAFASDAVGKSRGVAALLALFLGWLGIHYFYLGKTTAGIVTLLLSLVSCSIWYWIMVIQGILMLVMSNYDFDHKYVYTQNSFPLF